MVTVIRPPTYFSGAGANSSTLSHIHYTGAPSYGHVGGRCSDRTRVQRTATLHESAVVFLSVGFAAVVGERRPMAPHPPATAHRSELISERTVAFERVLTLCKVRLTHFGKTKRIKY